MSHKHGAFLIHRQQLQRLIWLIRFSISLTSARVFFAGSSSRRRASSREILRGAWATTILQRDFRIHAPIAAPQWARNTNHGGWHDGTARTARKGARGNRKTRGELQSHTGEI